MKCLVCVKYVPAEQTTQLDTDHSLVRTAGAQKLNTADEAAVEAALRLAGQDGVTVLCMGAAFCAKPMEELFARGVQHAVLVSGHIFAGADSLATAHTLALAVNCIGPFELILCGRRTLDGETGQVPAELAALLELPCITNALSVESGTGGFVCRRLQEDGIHTLSLPTPALVSLCEYSYPLRMPSLAELRAARNRRVQMLNKAELGAQDGLCGLAGSPTRVKSIAPHAAGRRHVKMAASAEEGAGEIAQLIGEVVH